MTLRGDQDGTAFQSLTVEGEDRVHFDIERPPLDLKLDPDSAPGLDWGSAADVLDRTIPDAAGPFVRGSASDLSPYLARPWLRQFSCGNVARFHPQVQGVESWRLVVANSRGQAVATFSGNGRPPGEIAWDGRSKDGQPVQPGLTYSYLLEARDRAGNKRNFVGEGFRLSSYRLQTPQGSVLSFTGASGTGPDARLDASQRGTSALVLEAASWLNQSPSKQALCVTATARSFAQANGLANEVARKLTPLLLGDPARVQTRARVEPDAFQAGTLLLAPMP